MVMSLNNFLTVTHDVVGFQDNHRSYILGEQEWTFPIPYELDANLGEKSDFMDIHLKWQIFCVVTGG